jgi:SHS2 domain-containing protein
MKYKFLPHTADIKFQAFGKSFKEVFENSALAMFKSISENKVKEKVSKKIKVKGKDFESLLYNFLEEFLVLFDSDNFLGAKIKNLKINIKKFEIKAEVLGDDAKNYETTHIKSVTYNEMFVKRLKDKFISQVVLDV